MNKNFPFIVIFYFLSLMMIMGVENWMSAWMILEMNTLSFIGILLLNSKSSVLEISISYFLVQTMSSLVFISSLYFNMIFSQLLAPGLLFVMAMTIKLAASPTHGWMVPVLSPLSWNLCLILLSAQKFVPLILLETSQFEWSLVPLFIILASLLLGSFSNFSSNSMKVMVIFSSISSMGWLYSAMLLSTYAWKIYFTLYIIMLSVIMQQSMKKNNSNFILLLGWLSMAGIPPMMGFFPKLLIMSDMIFNSLIILAFLLVMFSLLDTFIYFRLNYPSLLLENITHTNSFKSMKLFKTWVTLNLLMLGVLLM